MSNRRTIQYGIILDGGIVARVGNRVAFTVLDFGHMSPENNYEARYTIEEDDLLVLAHAGPVRWTRKLPIEVKNIFRRHFGLPELRP